MKIKFIVFLVVLQTLLNAYPALQAQPHDDQQVTSANSAITDGIKYGRKKKFEKAKENFKEVLQYWQYHAGAALYIRIIDDALSTKIKKKNASNIFKAIQNDYETKYEKALKNLNKLVKKNKAYFPLYLARAEVLANLDEYEKAEQDYTEAVNLADSTALPYVLRGKYYAKTDEPDKAIDDFTKAVAADPACAIGLFERGFIYCVNQKYDEAIRDFEIVGQFYPAWAKSAIVNEAFYNRGILHLQEKSSRKAIKDFARAIDINPDYLNSYLNRGIAYKNLKSYNKALRDFGFCIEKNPEFKEAYLNRALLNYDRGKYQTAKGDLEAVLSLDPRNKKAQYQLANCYYKTGKQQKAITHFNRVIKMDPGYFWAYYWKGYASKDVRQFRQAYLAFRAFLKYAPQKYYKQRLHAENEVSQLKKYAR